LKQQRTPSESENKNESETEKKIKVIIIINGRIKKIEIGDSRRM